MLAKKPMTARDNMIDVPDWEDAVMKAPAPHPKKKIIRLLRLPYRSEIMPHGSAPRPKRRYMRKLNFSTSARLIFSEIISGMANAGKMSS